LPCRPKLARRLLLFAAKRFLGIDPIVSGGCNMKWTKPEFEVVELGMEVGAYAGNA
jgi:coenzyme PQQ precursor peptide PqqA